MKLTAAVAAVLIAGATAFALGRASATTPSLNPETRDNLKTAMHGEAFAHAKYLLYADQARKSGNTEIADLFERTGKQERVEHLAEQAELVNLVRDDEANLKDAIAGESYEVDTMYPEFAAKARAAGDTVAADRFEEIRRDEINHRDAFKAALERLHTVSHQQ